MPNQSFADLHGFVADPFASTNSEDEELLEDYFVPPPYFAAVLGDTHKPKAKIVFAPRGSGKTAQRRMIELASLSKEEPFVCVTYDTFDVSKGVKLTLEQHLVELCKLLCVAVLEYLERVPREAIELNDHEKRIVKIASQTYIGSMSESEYTQAFSAVKSLGDKASEVWKRYGGVIAAAVTAVMKKAGMDDISIPAQMAAQAKDTTASAAYFFKQLVAIIVGPLRGGSIYILVDKVDETDKTSVTSSSAWDLISSLVTDLTTVETAGVGFKFFLWDQLENSFREEGGRPDRLQPVKLQWTVPELETMLSRRLSAYSDGVVTSFNDIYEGSSSLDAHALLAQLSGRSPRDMIRMAEAVAAEHTRTSQLPHLISEKELLEGVRSFADERSQELYSKYFSDLKKVGVPSFTINHLANLVFNVSGEAARSKVQKWVNAGAVAKIGELPNKKNKPLHLYAFEDIRLMLATNPRDEVVELLGNYALECPSCRAIVLTAEKRLDCPSCSAPVALGSARTLLDIVSR